MKVIRFWPAAAAWLAHECFHIPVFGAAQAALLQEKAATWVGSAARQARARTPPLDGAPQSTRRMLAAPAGPAAAGAGGAGGGPEGAGGDAGARKAPSEVLQVTQADAAAAAGERLAYSVVLVILCKAPAMWALVCFCKRDLVASDALSLAWDDAKP